MVSYEAYPTHFIRFCSTWWLTSILKRTLADYSVSANILTLSSGATPKSEKADSAATGPISAMFNVIRGILNPDLVKTTQGVYRFDLSGSYDITFK